MEKETNRQSKEYLRLIIGLCVLFVILGAFILYLAIPLITGKTIILSTRPVDPFDIFRGQYLTIRYDISSIPAISDVNVGDKVYVSLQEGEDKIWKYLSASKTKPSGTFIKGIVQSDNGDSMGVEYGIEQYFFERDAELPTQNITVEAKVDGSGNARIVRLLQNGKPAEIKYPKDIAK